MIIPHLPKKRFKTCDSPVDAEMLLVLMRNLIQVGRSVLAFILVFCIFISAESASILHAGTSACQWVVVVNGESADSRTLANHFVYLRGVPARNVIVLGDIPKLNTISVQEFRKRILKPLLEEMDRRELSPHIQGIAYSCDFPTTIDLQKDLEGIDSLPKVLTPKGSLNGMTFLYRWVLSMDPAYIAPDSNWYAAHEAKSILKLTGQKEDLGELERLISEKEYAKAADRIDALRKSGSKNYPLDYLSAQQHALAGNTARSLARLEEAIRNGWKFRSEMLKDPCFESMRGDIEFKKLVAKCPNEPFTWLPARSFDARLHYAPNSTESFDPSHGVPYLLSVMLSYTKDDRLSLDEAIKHLERSVLADYTQPRGSFFYTKTRDVRTTTREPLFSEAVEHLKKMKKTAEVIRTTLPPAGSRVAGITMGVADFDWGTSGATLLPGSLADNLTSMGAVMTPGSAQTKATEFLKNGAAMASGTVTEPYAVQFKFPTPMLHAYYAQGFTSAEAFYSAIQGPYQLLILGDPLCQPYAKPPRFIVQGAPNEVESGKTTSITFSPSEESNSTDPIEMSWLLNGRMLARTTYQPEISISVDSGDRGAQEWRFLAKGPKPVESFWESAIWVFVGPKETHLRLEGPKSWKLEDGSKFKVKVREPAAGTPRVRLRNHWELLDCVPNDQGEFEVEISKVGQGPCSLQPVVIEENGKILYEGIPAIVKIQ